MSAAATRSIVASRERTCLGSCRSEGWIKRAKVSFFTNDTDGQTKITAPESRLAKIYHVQVDRIPSSVEVQQCLAGVQSAGELLRCSHLSLIRSGKKNAWVEVTLHEGKNRQIRRIFAGPGLDVLRLIRISIGPLKLGDLAKGRFRLLTPVEVAGVCFDIPRLEKPTGGIIG